MILTRANDERHENLSPQPDQVVHLTGKEIAPSHPNSSICAEPFSHQENVEPDQEAHPQEQAFYATQKLKKPCLSDYADKTNNHNSNQQQHR